MGCIQNNPQGDIKHQFPTTMKTVQNNNPERPKQMPKRPIVPNSQIQQLLQITRSTQSGKQRIIQIPKDQLEKLQQRTKEERSQNKFKFIYEEDLYQEHPEIERQIFDQNTIKGQTLYQVTDADFKDDKFHNYIGPLLSYNPLNKSKQIKGTAALIAPNLVLTVAHNFYDKLNDTQNIDIRFYPGVNGKLSKYYEVESFFYPEEYEILQTAECDFAIAKLKTRVTQVDDCNYLQIGFGFKDNEAFLSIFGYPADDNYKVIDKNGQREAFQRGLSRKQLRSIQNNIISYNISTLGGQSGCPIITGNKKNMIVGVHKAGAKQKGELYNLGRYVNIDMILRMQIWRQRCNGDKFKVVDMSTNSELDLNSPIFREMKEMFKNEQRKSIRLKKIFEHNMTTKQMEMEQLQKKIQTCGGFQNLDAPSIIKQNNSLKRIAQEREMQLKTSTIKLMEVQKMNKEYKSQLNMYREELSSMVSAHETIKSLNSKVESFVQKIAVLEDQLIKKESIPPPIIILNTIPNHLIQWDPKASFAKYFKIDNYRLSLRYDDSKYQIVAQAPFPKNVKTTVVFKMLKYGGKQDICMGIIVKERLQSQVSGCHEGSVGYFTRKQTGVGWISVDSKLRQARNKSLLIPEDGQMEMIVDLISYELTFINKKQEGGTFCKIGLSEIYRQQEIYAFCTMYCKNDMIETIS